MIYFDNAASSFPKPYVVNRAVFDWLNKNGANPGRSGHKMSLEASKLVFETRSLICNMFGANEIENVAFVPNATYGLNLLIHGVLKKGDHAVTTDLEHNSVLRPLNMLSSYGISYSVATTDLYDDEMTVKNIASSIKPNTKAVICTHCSNVCGKILPIKKISECLPKGVLLIIDGSQSAGIIPTNIQKLGIDYYCAPSHKGLLSPQGCGFVIVNNKLPNSVFSGGTGSDSFNLRQPDYMPDIFEMGTLPTPVIAGMFEGLKYINSIGIENIFEKKLELTKKMYDSICGLKNVETYLNVNKTTAVSLIPFNIKNCNSEIVAQYLSANGIYVRSGYHCAPLYHKKMGTEKTGMVRISLGYFNTQKQIVQLIKLLNNYKKL